MSRMAMNMPTTMAMKPAHCRPVTPGRAGGASRMTSAVARSAAGSDSGVSILCAALRLEPIIVFPCTLRGVILAKGSWSLDARFRGHDTSERHSSVGGGVGGLRRGLGGAEDRAGEPRAVAGGARVDADLDREAGADESGERVVARHRDADRHALDDLSEIADGVLRRQQAEHGAARRREAFHGPAER